MADLLSPADDEPVLTVTWAAYATPADEGGDVPAVMLVNGRLKCGTTIPPGGRLVAVDPSVPYVAGGDIRDIWLFWSAV